MRVCRKMERERERDRERACACDRERTNGGDNLLNCYCYFYVKCPTAHTMNQLAPTLCPVPLISSSRPRPPARTEKFCWLAPRRRLHVASICINYVKCIRTTKGTSQRWQQQQQQQLKQKAAKNRKMYYKKQILYNNFALMPGSFTPAMKD